MKKSILFALMCISLLAFSCTKETPPLNVATVPIVSENKADAFVANQSESVIMTPYQLDMFMEVCQIWPRSIVEKFVCSAQDTAAHARHARYQTLMSYLDKGENEPVVETIIQYNSKKRIIDANASTVALTIANIGMQTNGEYLSIDYYRSASNTINNTDVYLAGWALNTSMQNGNQFAANDAFLEFQDAPPTFVSEFSGGNFEIEAVVVYNGPSTAFTFYNVITGEVETRTIDTGEILVYGPDSEYGSLFFNLTLVDETFGSPTYNTATIVGPIPGTDGNSQAPIALTGGDWPVVV